MRRARRVSVGLGVRARGVRVRVRRASLVDLLDVERADAVKVHRPPSLIHLVGVEEGRVEGRGEGG